MNLPLLDPGDGFDPDDRTALHRALAASQEDVEAGRLIDAEEVLRELRTL
jgi:predicted outer membrane protein